MMAAITQGIDEESRIFAAIAAPFREERQRPGRGGKVFRYVPAEAIMNRFDEAVGPANWQYWTDLKGDWVHCRIQLRMPNGHTVERCGASALEHQDDRGNVIKPSDVIKRAYTDAFKVAAKAMGAARYLKGDGGPDIAGNDGASTPARRPPLRAPREFPPGAAGPSEPPRQGEFPSRQTRFGSRPGSQLFRVLSNPPHNAHNLELVAHYGRRNGFPERIVNWTEDQCEEAMNALSSGSISMRQ